MMKVILVRTVCSTLLIYNENNFSTKIAFNYIQFMILSQKVYAVFHLAIIYFTEYTKIWFISDPYSLYKGQ